MNSNLTVKMGNYNHGRYLPELLDLVVSGMVNPTAFITQHEKPIRGQGLRDLRPPQGRLTQGHPGLRLISMSPAALAERGDRGSMPEPAR
ncbi:Threonine dehydrogenase and related Zn-dependent dehydrogenase [Actinokineospora spheciospongiae]|uniref:Threonine dehydrogenase and related Zn-dependent dehydrogenase n=1 Tax=Actinokineospora spheciospongiae TaxID=909613 RepID=W7J638_9PSEU|nr:hypothetical protein [Actinokineospora spheciospongiae]EWC64481.1 Threonine dehydrogenase and related Zn-dependent dehydrogenase [Actinokineospora spheciospongiae]